MPPPGARPIGGAELGGEGGSAEHGGEVAPELAAAVGPQALLDRHQWAYCVQQQCSAADHGWCVAASDAAPAASEFAPSIMTDVQRTPDCVCVWCVWDFQSGEWDAATWSSP